MLRNYFLVALRNLKRNLSYSVINVFGLALGITCSLILFLLINFFNSFDKNHTNGDRIYRLVTLREENGVEDHQPGVSTLLPDAVRADFSGLDDVLFASYYEGGLVTIENNGDRKLFEEKEGIAFTQANFFTFFNRKIIAGAVGSFTKPNEVIISKSLAEKYFGEGDPLGKNLKLFNQYNMVVVAIMEDVPDNTNFPFTLIGSYQTIRDEKERNGWHSINSNDQCYVMLSKNATPNDVISQFPPFILKYLGEETAQRTKMTLQPLSDLMFDDRLSNFRFRTVTKESLLAMGAVAIFLLLTACINFINLSTAVAVKRSKEVGIRKVMGSQRVQLMAQYFLETSLITLIALLASIGLAEIGLIELNVFFETNIHINFSSPPQLIFIGAVWLFVSFASGLYPALLLSGFSPVAAIKNKMSAVGARGYSLRRTLVVFQFVISQVLIVGTIIMLSQMNYFESKDLGFVKDAIITVPLHDFENLSKKRTLKKEVDRLPGVMQSSLCLGAPSSSSTYNSRFRIEGGLEEGYRTELKKVDGEYLDLFEIPLIAGRPIQDLDTANGWVVNQKLMELVGIDKPEDILGKKITMSKKTFPVIGVVHDFHTLSLNQGIYPTLIYNDADEYFNIAIRLKGKDFSSTIKEIEKAWSVQYPDYLFNYEFLDETVSKFYEREQKMSVLLIVFSTIAIVIGCLGLYGLISYMANEKEKEIGVRKVLGASSGQIMFIFSKELLILVLISFIIASPLAGYVMNGWLQNFAYHIDLNWSMFAVGVITTLIIAFITVGYRTVKAAHSNPVDTLRSE